MIRNFFRHFWDSIKSLKRNFWMSLISTSMVTFILTLVALFSMVLMNTQRIAEGIEKNIKVNVYLVEGSVDPSETVINSDGQKVVNENYHKLYDKIKKMNRVSSITYSNKDEQLKQLQATYGDDWKLFAEDPNAILDVYVIETKEPSDVKTVAKEIKTLEGVEDVNYGGSNTDVIFKTSNFIKIWGFIATGVLILIAIFLISNTIKLTILSRKRDIEIMRLVGAKNSYIRGPFFFEGAWVGMIGAILPSLMIYFLYHYLYKTFNPGLVSQGLTLYPTNIFIPVVIASLFAIGILIGAMGSVLSMRRYLKF